VSVERRLRVVLAGEAVIAGAARRHGVPAESISRWRNRFVVAGRVVMEDGIPGGEGGGRGNIVERPQRSEIQELKLALAETTCSCESGRRAPSTSTSSLRRP
jgi:transposase